MENENFLIKREQSQDVRDLVSDTHVASLLGSSSVPGDNLSPRRHPMWCLIFFEKFSGECLSSRIYLLLLQLRIMISSTDYIEDEVYGQRLLISVNADQRELISNIRAARSILHSFADVTIIINAHTMSFGHKNPEYTIDGQLGDRKGIMGEKGVTAGFKAAKKQGCKIVVIDLDEHILQVRSFELSKYISRRKADFVSGMIAACYVVYCGEAVVVNASVQTRQEIMSVIEQLNPGAPSY